MELMKLSIGIPTYNRREFLEQTLEGLLKQLQEGVEIIISDNGSTDGTKEWLRNKYPQITVVGFEVNQGIDANIVSVIEASHGEYLFLFSDDDLLPQGAVIKILQEIENSLVDVICLNHFPFKQHDVLKRLPDSLISKRLSFSCGNKFFSFCGLGFLSSLIVKKSKALPFLGKVRFGKECAHVDVIARVALQQGSLCVLRGDISVAGRSLPIPRYDLMKSCVINLKELYDELFLERLLDKKTYRIFSRRLVYKEIPRIFYKLLCQDSIRAYSSLELVQKSFPRLFLKILYLLNKKIVLFFFSSAFYLIQGYRRLICYNKSNQ